MYDAEHYSNALEQFLETVSLFGYDQRKVDNNLKSIVSLGGFQFQTPSFQDYNQKEIEKSKRKLVDLITGIRRSLPTDSYRYPTLTEDYVHDALIGALDEAIEEQTRSSKQEKGEVKKTINVGIEKMQLYRPRLISATLSRNYVIQFD